MYMKTSTTYYSLMILEAMMTTKKKLSSSFFCFIIYSSFSLIFSQAFSIPSVFVPGNNGISPSSSVPSFSSSSPPSSSSPLRIRRRMSTRGDKLTSQMLAVSPSSSPLASTNQRRQSCVAGNWKCNGTQQKVKELVEMLNGYEDKPKNVDVIVAPSFLHVGYVKNNLRPDVKVATQDVGLAKGYGAFTGEVSGDMIKDFGIDWSIVGHSERREGFGMNGEDNALVARKVRSCFDQGVNPIVCIGEKLQQRQDDKTMEVISTQLESVKNELTNDDWSKLILAYEPVWAIGTGETATPAMAQDVHESIRRWIRENVDSQTAESVRILYGGSVKGSNAKDLFAEKDIDGFLVGGASLTNDFLNILQAAAINVADPIVA